MSASTAQPPQFLGIFREPLKPGGEAAYDAIESDTAQKAAALGCPHPYLAAESVTGAAVVWWFNAYISTAEQKQVADAYASNSQLMEALRENGRRKAPLTLAPVEVVGQYRRDLSADTRWTLGQGRFLVIQVTKTGPRATGTVFEAPDGTRFVIMPAHTREAANALHASAGDGATILRVRPSWSFPAPEWISRDREFWKRPPTASR